MTIFGEQALWNPEDDSTLGHGPIIQHSEIGVLEARGSGDQSCTWVLTKLKASLVYMRPYLKIEKRKNRCPNILCINIIPRGQIDGLIFNFLVLPISCHLTFPG